MISVHVGDEGESAYEEVQRRGFEIVSSARKPAWLYPTVATAYCRSQSWAV